MRTDVKIALVAAIVLIILVIVYIELVKPPRKAVMQNTEASSAPPLVQSSNPAADTGGLPAPGDNSVGGAASVPVPSPATLPTTTGPAATSPSSPATSPATSVGSASGNSMGGTTTGSSLADNSATQASTAPAASDTTSASAGLDNGLGTDNSGLGSVGGNPGSSSSSNSNSGGLNDNSAGLGSSGGLGSSTGGNSGSALSSSAGSGSGSGSRYYRIRRGDTLVGISRAIYGTPAMVTAIEAANPGVSARDLRIGQRIRLPRKTHHFITRHRSVRRHRTAGRRVSRSGRTYVVRRGDDLYSIARRMYHNPGDWKIIYRANRRKIGSNPAHIYVGERLNIPAR